MGGVLVEWTDRVSNDSNRNAIIDQVTCPTVLGTSRGQVAGLRCAVMSGTMNVDTKEQRYRGETFGPTCS